jgi:hypothetical protein
VKRTLVAVATVAVLLVAAAPPAGAANLARQVAALQRQVNGLKKQVTTLKKQVTAVKKQASTTAACPSSASTLPAVCEIALEGAVVAYCTAAITGDAFQNTWAVINQVGNGSIMFGARETLDDSGLCSAVRVTRQPTLVPPTISPFSQMMAFLNRSRPAVFPQPLWNWPT